MIILRISCIAMLIGILVFTASAVALEGTDLITPFTSNLLAMNWSGQFNFDFMCYLFLSTLWFLWRNGFSGASIAASPLVMTGGILVLGLYLLVMSFRVDNRIDVLLLGPERAGPPRT